ncbi:MAG: hypothetical protein QM739_12850 [Propionivibrio sp.]
MNIKYFRALALSVLLAANASAAVAEEAAPALVEIVSAEFGIFNAGNPNELTFEPTRVVPHRAGQRYGWVIEVRSSQRSLSVREEYLLPNPVKTPKSDNPIVADLEMPLYRHNQVSQRQLVPVDGKIYGEWEVGPNEPAGHRHLQVVIEDQVAAAFEYDVK